MGATVKANAFYGMLRNNICLIYSVNTIESTSAASEIWQWRVRGLMDIQAPADIHAVKPESANKIGLVKMKFEKIDLGRHYADKSIINISRQ